MGLNGLNVHYQVRCVFSIIDSSPTQRLIRWPEVSGKLDTLHPSTNEKSGEKKLRKS